MYLLDTNICIYYLKPRYRLDRKVDALGLELCSISEITIAEMKFGAEKVTAPRRIERC
jgi:tRNA(fMet)-specific endonuclease VapC